MTKHFTFYSQTQHTVGNINIQHFGQFLQNFSLKGAEAELGDMSLLRPTNPFKSHCCLTCQYILKNV